MKQSRNEILLFALLAFVLVALEIYSGRLAYETIGAVTSTLYFMALGLNLVFILLAVRYRTAAAVGLVLLAALIVPYQFFLADRMWQTQAEATRIVGWSYETKLSTGEYPSNLAGYVFRNPEVKPYIHSFARDSETGGFWLCYLVGTRSTSHCYSPRNGWTYYPD